MYNVVDLNDITNIELRTEWDRVFHTAKYEALYLLNYELIKRESLTFLLHVFRNHNIEIYEMKVINPTSLEFEINGKERVFLNDLINVQLPKEALYISSTFPYIFSLALDSNYFEKERGFYKKILKKNERFEAISNFIDGKIDNKLEYDKALFLFALVKLSERRNELVQIMNKKKSITIIIFPEDEVRQIDNILYLLYDVGADEILKTLVFRGKYLSKPEKRKPEEYIVYQLNNSNLIIPIEEINNLTESKYKIRFEKMSPLAFYRKLSRMK